MKITQASASLVVPHYEPISCMMWCYQSGKKGASGIIPFNAIPRLQNYLTIPAHTNKGWRYMADKNRTQEKSKKAMTKKARQKKKKVKS